MPPLNALSFEQYAGHFKGPNFRNPTLLGEPLKPRLLLVGPCTLERIAKRVQGEVDMLLYHQGPLPQPPKPVGEYDAVLFGVSLRELLPDAALWAIPMNDEAAFEALYRRTRRDLERKVELLASLCQGTGTPAFFMNFAEPVLNPNGRLMPADSYGNIRHFIHQLNLDLDRACRDQAQAHVLDFDAILSTHGKMHFTDEFTEWYAHNSFFPVPRDGHDGSRMEATPMIVEHFTLYDPRVIADAVLHELAAQVKTLQQRDQVKLIVVDLDDTLWRGVIGDQAATETVLEPGSLGVLVEGWPLGLAEALMYCKKRGILLSIISRNDEATIRKVFPAIFGSRLSLDDFSSIRINFEAKPSNMAAILAEVNLLPSSVVYIDDNPQERAQMEAAFPALRVVGKYFLYTRQMLLHAPETQVARVSAESAQRGQMIRANQERQQQQSQMDPAAFLTSLEVKARMFDLTLADSDPRAFRAVELINKTNQWNSTGERVDAASLAAGFAAGESLYGFSVGDRFGHHGDACFVRLHGEVITQFVMSCRLAGMQVEREALRHLLTHHKLNQARVRFRATGRNAAFETFIRSVGSAEGEDFIVTLDSLDGLRHISFS